MQDADERLVKALLAKVESSTGYRADEADIAQFLQGQTVITSSVAPTTRKLTKPKPSTKAGLAPSFAPETKPAQSLEIGMGDNWYCINEGPRIRSQKAVDTTLAALRELAATPGTLEEIERQILLSQQQNGRKVNKRRWLARSREELYMNPQMHSASVEIISGWWLGTNYSNADKEMMLKTASKVAATQGFKLEFSLASKTPSLLTE